MIVVGVLLIVLAALFVAGFVLAPGGNTEAEFFGLILPNLSARTLILVGLALGLVLALGFSVVRSRIAAWSKRRKARRLAAAQAPAGVGNLGDEPTIETLPTPAAGTH